MLRINLATWITLCSAFSVSLSLTVEKGQNATLDCPLGVQFPTWEGPATLNTPLTPVVGMINETGMAYSDTDNSSLVFDSTELKHNGNYTCSSGGQNETVQLMVISTDPVFDFTIEGYYLETVTATCTVRGSYPEPTVYFHFTSDPNVAFNYTNTNVTVEDDMSFIVIQTAEYEALPALDGEPLYCTANFTELGVNASQEKTPMLKVKPTESVPAPLYVDLAKSQMMTLRVETVINPGADLFFWTIDGQPIPVKYNHMISNECVQVMIGAISRYNCTSNLTLNNLEKSDNGKIYRCELEYEGINYTIASDQTIQLNFKPTEAVVSGETSVALNASGAGIVSLTCDVDESNPVNSPIWTNVNTSEVLSANSSYDILEIQTLGNYSANTTSSTIQIPVDRNMDGQIISCCAITNETCDTATLNISYPPMIVSPVLDEFHVYVGDNLTIECRVDSKPESLITWKIQNGSTVVGDVDPAMTHSGGNNELTLVIDGADANHTGDYRCEAVAALWNNQIEFKLVKVTVMNKPKEPTFNATGSNSQGESPYVDITYTLPPTTIPRTFYIQYKLLNTTVWVQVSTTFADNLPGENKGSSRFTFQDGLLTPGETYEVRILSVDSNGLTLHSTTKTLDVWEEPRIAVEDDSVSYSTYRNAIIISVFATAGFFLIAIVLGVCCCRGKCSSNSKSYAM